MIAAISPHFLLMAVTSDAMAHTVPLSAHKDTDPKVDGRSNAKPITPGPTPNSLHVLPAPVWTPIPQTSMPKFKTSLLKTSQLLNFSVVTHLTSWS